MGARRAMAGRTCVSFLLLLSPLVIWEGRPSWGEGRPAAPGPCKMGGLESWSDLDTCLCWPPATVSCVGAGTRRRSIWVNQGRGLLGT